MKIEQSEEGGNVLVVAVKDGGVAEPRPPPAHDTDQGNLCFMYVKHEGTK